MKRNEIKDDIEKIKKELQRKNDEIEQIRKKLAELNEKISASEDEAKPPELEGMIREVSELLDTGFNIMGLAGGKRGGEGGFLGLVDGLSRLAERSEEVRRDFEFAGKKGTISYRVNYGTLGGPAIRPGGPRGKPKGGVARPLREQRFPGIDEELSKREPFVEVIEGENDIIVIMDLPGVTEKDVGWEIDGDKFTVITQISGEKHTSEVKLPSPVLREGVESRYHNGIFEVKLKKPDRNVR